MAQIVYKPHCSNCGAVIEDEITYIEHVIINKIKNITPIDISPISPCKCPYCGKYFDSIIIKPPKKEQ
jgi:hypothetical protein